MVDHKIILSLITLASEIQAEAGEIQEFITEEPMAKHAPAAIEDRSTRIRMRGDEIKDIVVQLARIE